MQQDPGYQAIDPHTYCRAFVRFWLPRVRNWFVIFGDHVTNAHWLEALEAADLYTFAPVVWLKPNAAPRFMGDGPSSQCEYIAIARHRKSVPKRYRPGRYTYATVRHTVMGEKPIELMRALVRDYSEPGERILDPHAGSGTTLLAAALEARSAIGAEMDGRTHALALERLKREASQRQAAC